MDIGSLPVATPYTCRALCASPPPWFGDIFNSMGHNLDTVTTTRTTHHAVHAGVTSTARSTAYRRALPFERDKDLQRDCGIPLFHVSVFFITDSDIFYYLHLRCKYHLAYVVLHHTTLSFARKVSYRLLQELHTTIVDLRQPPPCAVTARHRAGYTATTRAVTA